MKKSFSVLAASSLIAGGFALVGPAADAAYPGTVATSCGLVAKEIRVPGHWNTVKAKGKVTAGNAVPTGTITLKVAKKSPKSGPAPLVKRKFHHVKPGRHRKVRMWYTPTANSPFKACSMVISIRVHH